MIPRTDTAVRYRNHDIAIKTDGLEVLSGIFGNKIVEHGIEINSQLSTVCGCHQHFKNPVVIRPLSQPDNPSYPVAPVCFRFTAMALAVLVSFDLQS